MARLLLYVPSKMDTLETIEANPENFSDLRLGALLGSGFGAGGRNGLRDQGEKEVVVLLVAQGLRECVELLLQFSGQVEREDDIALRSAARWGHECGHIGASLLAQASRLSRNLHQTPSRVALESEPSEYSLDFYSWGTAASNGVYGVLANIIAARLYVVMVPYLKTSPSQITRYELCERRWHFGSVQRLPQPQSKEAVAGELLHKQLENYSLHGTMPTDPSCLKAIEWIAPPKSEGVVIEAKTVGLKIAGLDINGRVDHTDGRDQLLPHVLDWKSKGHFKSLMSKRKLESDVQLNIYGQWAFTKYAGAAEAKLSHGYLIRPGGAVAQDAKMVSVTLTRDHVQANIDALVPTIKAMKVAYEIPASEVESLRANRAACWAFGQRCPYMDICPAKDVTFADMFPRTTIEEDVTLLETLKTSPGAANVPDPARFAAPTTGGTAGGSLLDRLRAMPSIPAAPPAVASSPVTESKE